MKKELIELAKYRLGKAQNTLDDAKKYFENATLESTVNRIYYSMFYAVNALLLTKGLAAAKHSGVRALFNREFVNTGIVERDQGKFYAEMFDRRQKGDYSDFVKFEREDVEVWLRKAVEFIDQIKKTTNLIIEDKQSPDNIQDDNG
jgi:uncharacterized protein (UPF0332 family)